MPAQAFPKPVLKWAGGKRQLLATLIERVQRVGDFHRYHEPFFGGGALFFEMHAQGMLSRRRAYLSDANVRLIECYDTLRDNVATLLQLLSIHADLHCPEYFYATRAEAPSEAARRAARLIYLNRTCFNGLYRENSRGEFNVPMGRYKNPRICDEDNLLAVSAALKKAKLFHRDFEAAAHDVVKGDFIYLDPPYDPISPTSYFTSYHANEFTREDQERLARVYRELDQRGAKLLLSNSDTPFIRSLYKGFTIETVYARRNVNSQASKRGPVAEVLVRNY